MKRFFAALLLLLLTSLGLHATSTLDVYVLDVGQGDAILLDYGTYELLIDGGADGSCVPVIEMYVDGYLEIVIATHPHSDHIGGLDEVIRAFDVLQVISNGTSADTNSYRRFLAAVDAEGCPHRVVRRNEAIQWADLELRVLHPYEISGDANEDSLVLQLAHGDVDFLFTGDIGETAERELLEMGCLSDVDVLKVAHHGSRYASTDRFLDAVQPELAVYSAGVGNRYGHPHHEALGRLSVSGAWILGTDHVGTIWVASDGATWTARDLAGNSLLPGTECGQGAERLFLAVEPISGVGQGHHATVNAQTLPGAECSIVVYYGDSASAAQGLTAQTADDAGCVRWTWRIGTRTKPGNHRVVITATSGDEQVTQTIWFEVLDTGSPG